MSPARNASAKRPRRPRGSLSEDEILDAAVAIIERDGVDGLSMPNLAKYLNAGVMSVYWYFHSKDDLLFALADRALLEVYSHLTSIGDRSWDQELLSAATALHRELRKRSLYLQLGRAYPACLALRPTVVPVLARRLEAELQVFRDVSVSVSEAARFLIILATYARGFALMQVGVEQERHHGTVEKAFEASVGRLNPERFPTLRSASDAGGVVSVSDRSLDTALRLMVAGMTAELERSTAS